MGQGACEEEDGNDDEECVETADVDGIRGLRVAIQARGIVPGEEASNAHDSVPEHFDGDVGQYKGLPGVRLGLALAGFVEGALQNPHGQDLVDELDDDEEEDEDAKHLVLQALHCVCAVDEGEADHEGAADG